VTGNEVGLLVLVVIGVLFFAAWFRVERSTLRRLT
jgi:hypothetical protein